MSIELLDVASMFQLVCKSNRKYGLMITPNFHYATLDDVCKAAPMMDHKTIFKYKGKENQGQAMADGYAFFLFDSYDKMMDYFESVVGDSGPTRRNKYKGPAAVYALTCDNEGQLLTENT